MKLCALPLLLSSFLQLALENTCPVAVAVIRPALATDVKLLQIHSDIPEVGVQYIAMEHCVGGWGAKRMGTIHTCAEYSISS